jgi:methyl-accepting chemotaxis protein
VALADELACGNLRQARFGLRGDEFGRLQTALSAMRDRLTGIVADTRSGIREIADVSSRIASTSTCLSEHNAEQSSRLKQTAVSMEKVMTTVAQNTASAQQATQLAASASSVAAKGGEVVTQVVQTMERISASSRKIHDIIGVIDGLAFQTNILALNAAVEAARAGEGGRGFAVVAAEVRSLAQRSAEAAKAINSLITESVGNVSAGSELVNHAGRTMEDIVNQVRRVSELVDTISAASAGQGRHIEDAVQAVTRLDQATRRNAALVAESATAAGNLNDEAHRLSQTVAVFTVSEPERAPGQSLI